MFMCQVLIGLFLRTWCHISSALQLTDQDMLTLSLVKLKIMFHIDVRVRRHDRELINLFLRCDI